MQIISLIRLLAGLDHLAQTDAEVLVQDFMNLDREILLAVNADIIVDEITLRHLLHIGGDDFRIVSDDRTVIIVVGIFFTHVVGHARIENRRDLLVKQRLDRGVNQFGRETDRVGRN